MKLWQVKHIDVHWRRRTLLVVAATVSAAMHSAESIYGDARGMSAIRLGGRA